ncbi:MAG: glycoside hydrolase family 3 C-terminal domain-containing protein [Clostridia bacterium]|nr:glycoside hydrolase family 3 C-terminal domain-containing protein [Clostridia bacterium]
MLNNPKINELAFEEKANFLTGFANMQTFPIKEKGVGSLNLADGPHGVRTSKEANCTHFPSLCNLASSWSVETAYLMGEALAKDCIKHNVDVLLGPGVNIKRHILCGRNFEYLSEDPVLAGELAAGYINGLQKLGVKACLKHLAVNNQEYDRLTISAEVDERVLREIYLKPFEIAVKKSTPKSVMCAYNKVNGIWCSENKYLLTDLLRNEWKFNGVVISDWGAVQNISRAIKAGLDLQMPPNPKIVAQLTEAVQNGNIKTEDIDAAVNRMLNFVEDSSKPEINYNRDEQHETAKKIAADGMVLLKNENNILPITTSKYKKVAVIGEYAVSPLIAGQGSAMVYQQDEYTDNPLEELKKRLPEVEFKYLEMYKKRELPADMLWPQSAPFRREVADCDLLLFFAGAMESEDTENFDRRTAYINQNIGLFIKSAKVINKPIVLILQNGGALILDKAENQADAILEAWLGGEATGGAIADILCGNINPSGKLCETFPNKMRTDLEYPGDSYKIEYKERFEVGYRYYDKHPDEILYPFGHGLSYTEFKYENLVCDNNNGIMTVGFDLTNTGDVDGAEVVQLYIGDPVSTIVKPIKELKKFQKVFLKAGETKRISFALNPSDYAYYNVMLREYVTENGRYDIYIGASSQDIRLTASFMYNNEASPYSINCKGETMIG